MEKPSLRSLRPHWGRGSTLRAACSATLLLLAAAATHAADTTYKIQPLVKVGDTIAGVAINNSWHLFLGGLNDKGQLAFYAGPAGTGGGGLFVSANGSFLSLFTGGQDGPVGKWPQNSLAGELLYMNQRGNVPFTAPATLDGKTVVGTFFWDAQTQKATVVSLPGMPAVNGLTFLPTPMPGYITQINNQDEITFAAHIADSTGKSRPASFFLGRDHVLRPVALPDQELPGGGTALQIGGAGNLNDAGVVAFRARRPGDPAGAFSAYQWENGVLTPLALVGGKTADGAEIIRVTGAGRLNNQNRTALLVLRVSTAPTQAGLYRFTDGQLKPVAVPGQAMPEGGKLAAVLEEYPSASGPSASGDVSQANEAGQHAFRARLEDGTRALYRLDPDGTLALLLKQGTLTELGEITSLLGGMGIGFNGRGQIAITLRIAGDRETLVLLTPTTP